MKETRTLEAFATELLRQQSTKRDFVLPANQIAVQAIDAVDIPTTTGVATFGTKSTFLDHIARELRFPSEFFKRTAQEHPVQWQALTNAMMQADPRNRMVRTLDGNARAYLSPSYQIIDNWQIASVALEAIGDKSNWQVVGSEITENSMYLKVMLPWVRDVRPGDPVRAGFLIRNGEIGNHSASIQMLIEREWCRNGAVRVERSVMRHASRPILADFTGGAFELSDKTRRLSDAALMSSIHDMVRGAVNQSKFEQFVNNFSLATGDVLPASADVNKVIDTVAKEYDIRESEKPGILHHLAAGGDLSRFGLLNAVTRMAQDVDSYDRSVELEMVGGAMIDMEPRTWNKIVTVASQN